MKKKTSKLSWFGTGAFTIIGIVYIMPILIVLINSFKNKVFINKEPFKLPTKQTWVGIDNFLSAIDKYELLSAVGWTVFITVGSVLVILVCTSMCAWYITRVNSKFTKLLYLLCVFSMVVPFQMVMFTLSLVADRTGLRTPWGIIIIYLGFGAGLAVFMFCGFVKSIPLEIEEAAMIDGCTPLRTFFSVVLPIMKPTYISVGILETMWIWNDFLLPYLVLDLNKYKTISIAIQYMKGSYGRVDMGAVMAVNTTTPDGYYVDENGVWDGNASTVAANEKNLGPGVDKGWEPIDIGWKFKQEDGTYLTNAWRQDSNGKWYYLNEDGWMLKDTNTPDGYHVDANGVWDGDAVTESEEAAE